MKFTFAISDKPTGARTLDRAGSSTSEAAMHITAIRRTLSILSILVLGTLSAALPARAGDPDEPAFASGNWGGLRDTLARRGVGLGFTLQADHSTNLAGGMRRGSALRRPLGAALDVDTHKLLGWQGGHLHFGAQALDGTHATEALVGDAQGFDNIDAVSHRQLSELWLEQRLWGERLRLKAGKVDANSEFAHVERSGEFLNSSAGFSPTIQGFPTYPDPAASLNVFVAPARWLELGAGLYDGATHEGCHGRTGNRGIATLWGAPSALFLVGEGGVRFDVRGRRGRLGVGAWKHNGQFEAFDGTTRRGTGGWYATLDQPLLREAEGAEREIGVFAQIGGADSGLSEIDRHVAVGVAATGWLPGRGADTLGVMLSAVRFSRGCAAGLGNHQEKAIEAFYGLQFRPWLSVKPDLQLILNPGGNTAPRAFVMTIRAIVSL